MNANQISFEIVEYFANCIQTVFQRRFYFLRYGRPKIGSERTILYYLSADADKVIIFIDGNECFVRYDKYSRCPIRIDISNHDSVIAGLTLAATPVEGVDND